VQSFNSSNESSAGVNNQSWRYVTSIRKENGISVTSTEESSVGNSTQSETGVTMSLEESTNVVSVFFENSSIPPEKEYQQQTQNKTGNDKQSLAGNASSLHHYSNGTARRLGTQVQHHALNTTTTDMKNSSEDVTRNLDTHYLHNISRSYVQDGNDLSSAETSTSSLPSQSVEHTTLSVTLDDTVTLSPHSLHTYNHDTEVLDDSLRNSSNTNDANLPSNMSLPQFFSYLTSIDNSTTPFPDLNRNFAEDFNHDTHAADGTTYKVPSNSSEHFSNLHTTKFPGQAIVTLIPKKLYKATIPPNISFISSATPETKNQANTSENTSPSHSESSAKSTTSAGYPSLFYSASANTNITTESPPITLAVLNNSTESRIMIGTATVSSKAASADVPQTSPVPVPNVDYSIMSFVTTVPSSIPSPSISTMKSFETWVPHITPVVPSVEAISSSKTSNTAQLAATVTSSTVASTLNQGTTYKSMSSLKSVSESRISSTVHFVETTSISSSSVPSSETVSSGFISATVPSSATITSNTISSAIPSTATVTPSTISTFFSTVPSVNYQLPTRDTIKGNKFQVVISGKNESSNSTDEELEKSFTPVRNMNNTTSLNVTCEVNILTPGKEKKIIHSDIHYY
jgi:hypothetical protein